MHQWGDDFKYFAEVGEAAQFIGDYCRKYGRIGVTQTKEKYGTARVYCGFGLYSLHSITHPGYVYSQYPKWLWCFDIGYLSKIIRLFNPVIVRYQMFIYRRAYHLAFKQWPLIKEEIISGADYPEIVSPYFEAVSLCSEHACEWKNGTVLLNSENCEICKESKQ